MHSVKLFIPALFTLALLAPVNAMAYIGPGLGAGTLGVILGLLGSLLLALFAFFWYPIKRALFGRQRDEEDEADAEEAMPAGDTETPAEKP